MWGDIFICQRGGGFQFCADEFYFSSWGSDSAREDVFFEGSRGCPMRRLRDRHSFLWEQVSPQRTVDFPDLERGSAWHNGMREMLRGVRRPILTHFHLLHLDPVATLRM
jgi:hypothetical protein